MTKADEVAEALRLRIRSGHYPVGSRLPAERRLAAEFGTARETLRLALKQLAEDGYVHPRLGSRGGWFVTDLKLPGSDWSEKMRSNRAEMDDILDFRIAVETWAAALAATRSTIDDIRSMASAIERLRAVGERALGSSTDDLRQADTDFHAIVGRASRSARLREALLHSRAELFDIQQRSVYEELKQALIADHEVILGAIRRHNPREAAEAMQAHIERGRDKMHEWLDSDTTHTDGEEHPRARAQTQAQGESA